MTEPDELYTLRAQYWLGHYQSAIDEARSVARRPMSPALKLEREEFLARSYLALGQHDKVTSQESPGKWWNRIAASRVHFCLCGGCC
jgi:coatomer subunit epsilon